MTYEERIIYSTGKIVQLSSYAIYNAFVLGNFLDVIERDFTSKNLEIAQLKARDEYSTCSSLGNSEIKNKLNSYKFSSKDLTKINYVIEKRDYVANKLFLDSRYDLEKEQVMVYQELIDLLDDILMKIKQINIDFSSECDKVYSKLIK